MNFIHPGSQVRDEDEAAHLRDEGRSWLHIARELAVTETACNLAAASDRRVDDLHHRQGFLFDI